MTSMSVRVRCTLLFSFMLVAAAPLFAQQTGAIRGKVTTTDGATLPGVTVTARSEVLPQPRETADRRERRVLAARAAARHLHSRVLAVRECRP